MLQLIQNTFDRTILSSPKREITILLIGDCPDLHNALAGEGYEVIFCHNTQTALQSFDRQFDILVSSLEEENQILSFCKRMRNDKRFSQLPIVLYSQSIDNPAIPRARELGCDICLTSQNSLNQEIASTIRGKQIVAQRSQNAIQEQLAAYRRQIINSLSHEFRTPLVAINTGTELLVDHHKNLAENEVENLLNSIRRGGLRLQRLVEDFMTIQQIEAGLALAAYERHKRPVLVAEVVESAVNSFEEFASNESKQCNVIVNIKPETREVTVDGFEIQLTDILQRLLQNADKFSQEGETIFIEVEDTNDTVSIRVCDRGIGLSAEEQEKAQLLFSQINRDFHEQQGCGIGLTIASYYTQIHGGDLLFHTPEDNIGLEVELRLNRKNKPHLD